MICFVRGCEICLVYKVMRVSNCSVRISTQVIFQQLKYTVFKFDDMNDR